MRIKILVVAWFIMSIASSIIIAVQVDDNKRLQRSNAELRDTLATLMDADKHLQSATLELQGSCAKLQQANAQAQDQLRSDIATFQRLRRGCR